MTSRPRGAALTVAAILFALLALSNFAKPLELNAEHGFVLFGQRLHGLANAVVAPLFGLLLAAYAVGIWRMRRWALPLGVAYAAYVVVNLICFSAWGPVQEGTWLFGVAYMLVAVGVSSGAAWLLARRRPDLA